MAEKKPKKSKKIMVADVPKATAPKSYDEIKAALLSLQASPGWAVILKVIDENIKYLELAILEKKDPLTDQPINDEEIERLRFKRSLTLEFRNTPADYIAKMQPGEETDGTENGDPYPKTAEDLKAMGNMRVGSPLTT